MARVRTVSNLKKNRISSRRAFIKGLERARRTALDKLAYQAFTEVSAIPLERTERTTITLPSDTDPANPVEMTTSEGQFQEFTFTFTEYRDEEGNFPWLESVKYNLPGSLVLTDGRTRTLNDPYSFSSVILLSDFTITGFTDDDSSNPSDGDANNPNKLTATATSHGRHRHEFTAADFKSEVLNATDSSEDIAGVTSSIEILETGGQAIKWYAVKVGGTSKKPAFFVRDEFGNWGKKQEFGANDDKVLKLERSGDTLITLSIDAANSGHWYANVDALDSATEVSHGSLTSSTSIPRDLWVTEAGEVWFVYGDDAATSKSRIAKASSPSATPVSKEAEGAANTRYNSIHGYGDQIVVGGSDTAVHAHASDARALIKVSNNGGETWTEVDPPKSSTQGIHSVFMTGKDTFFIGTSNGEIHWTYNFGDTWHSSAVDGGIGAIEHIVFLWSDGAIQAEELGYALGSTGRLYVTLSGGNEWVNRKSLVKGTNSGLGADFDNDIAVAGAHKIMVAGGSAVVKINE